MSHTRIWILSALIAGACAHLAIGQCPFDWQPGQGLSGLSGPVYATTTWDPDGSGTHPEVLVVGGHFTLAGQTAANNIAAWNGATWQQLGTGTAYFPPCPSCEGRVTALAVFDGELIAGGWFNTAGGANANYVARWNGTVWQPLGTGLPYWVEALTVHDGALIAGGRFGPAGGGVARWDGMSWQTIGSMDNPVYALSVYNGELIAGGGFNTIGEMNMNHISRWNGTSWMPLGTGMDYNGVLALSEYHGELIAGGVFITAGGESVNHIARWNGAYWQSMGSGLSPAPNEGAPVAALTVFRDELIVGGDFTNAGGIDANDIARWNGSTWQAMGAGTNLWGVYALTEFHGELIAGGFFNVAGSHPSAFLARWGPACRGDLNCDNQVNLGDVSHFVEALLATGNFVGCDINRADLNHDALIDGRDVSSFLDSLITP